MTEEKKEKKKYQEIGEYVNTGKPIVHNNREIFSDGDHQILLVGRTKSGKTWLLHKLLPMMRDPDLILISTGSPYQATYIDIANHYGRKGIPVWQFGEPVPLFEEMKLKKHIVCIFDDLEKKEMNEVVAEYFRKGRHYKCTSILITQNFFDVLPSIRKNMDMLIMFRSTYNMRNLFHYNNLIFKGNKEKFNKIITEILTEPYSFLMIDYTAPMDKAVRKNFELIEF